MRLKITRSKYTKARRKHIHFRGISETVKPENIAGSFVNKILCENSRGETRRHLHRRY